MNISEEHISPIVSDRPSDPALVTSLDAKGLSEETLPLQHALRRPPHPRDSFARGIAAVAAESIRFEMERQGTRALTVRRPWAQLIMDGYKVIENRSRPTKHRGLVVIHAGKGWDSDGESIAGAMGLGAKYRHADSCSVGYLGIARLVDSHPAQGCCAPWGAAGGKVWHWRFTNPIAFADPIPGPGQLGLFRISSEVHEAVIAEVSRWASRSAADDSWSVVE